MTPAALSATVPDGTRVRLAGTVTAIDPHITRQDNPWATVTLAASDGDVTVQVLPAAYRDYQALLSVGAGLDVVALTDSSRPDVMATRIALAEGGAR